jgi:hypothetical protein
MALRKNLKSQIKTIVFQIPIDSDLPSRIENISEQTGLDTLDLFQKWVLQEESLIGLMRHSGDHTTKQAETHSEADREQVPDVQEQKEPEKINPHDKPNYRKMLVKRAKKLQKEGMTLNRIAKTFNDENLPTVSGTGKWHATSLIRFLNAEDAN